MVTSDRTCPFSNVKLPRFMLLCSTPCRGLFSRGTSAAASQGQATTPLRTIDTNARAIACGAMRFMNSPCTVVSPHLCHPLKPGGVLAHDLASNQLGYVSQLRMSRWQGMAADP